VLCAIPALAGQNPDAVGTGAPQTNQQLSNQPQSEQKTALRISGRIVDQTGVAVVGARIALAGEDPSQSQEVLTGDDGLFTLVNAAPGPFHLTITAAGFAAQEFSGNLSSTENFVVPQIVVTVASVTTEVRVVPPSQFEIAREQIKEEEKQRALGIIPNFYVTYIPDAAPLVAKQKFELAWKSMVDPVTFGLTGAIAVCSRRKMISAGTGRARKDTVGAMGLPTATWLQAR